jgi:hypothetical protein
MNILNLGNAELIEYCNNFLKSFLKNNGYDIAELELISRLMWKNIVYKVKLRNTRVYSIKLVLNCNDPVRRFKSEVNMNNNFDNKDVKSFCILNYDEKLIANDEVVYAILIRKWVDGVSYMNVLKNDFDKFVNVCLLSIKCCCEEIWKLDCIEFTTVISNIKRYGLNPSLLLIKNYGDSGFAKFLSQVYEEIVPTDNLFCVVNSDFSLHEFITIETGQLIVIDWEDVSIGNKIIDIAGIYYSIFQYISQVFDFEKIMQFTEHYI